MKNSVRIVREEIHRFVKRDRPFWEMLEKSRKVEQGIESSQESFEKETWKWGFWMAFEWDEEQCIKRGIDMNLERKTGNLRKIDETFRANLDRDHSSKPWRSTNSQHLGFLRLSGFFTSLSSNIVRTENMTFLNHLSINLNVIIEMNHKFSFSSTWNSSSSGKHIGRMIFFPREFRWRGLSCFQVGFLFGLVNAGFWRWNWF